MEPETVKDAECQTIEFHYMFQTSRYEAQKEAFKEIYDIVCFYTGLPYMEILMVFFSSTSTDMLHCKHSRSTDFKSSLKRVHMKLRLNAPLQDLVYQFGVSLSTVSRIFSH